MAAQDNDKSVDPDAIGIDNIYSVPIIYAIGLPLSLLSISPRRVTQKAKSLYKVLPRIIDNIYSVIYARMYISSIYDRD